MIFVRICFHSMSEPPNDKTNKMAFVASEDSDQPGIRPVWSVMAVRIKK